MMKKTAILNFVESMPNRTATRREIVTFVLGMKGITYDPVRNRGYYSCAFCPKGDPWHIGHLTRPSKKEPRFLKRIGHGIYTVAE